MSEVTSFLNSFAGFAITGGLATVLGTVLSFPSECTLDGCTNVLGFATVADAEGPAFVLSALIGFTLAGIASLVAHFSGTENEGAPF